MVELMQLQEQKDSTEGENKMKYDLNKYIKELESGDAKKFATLFAEDCVFHDTAPTQRGMDLVHFEGR